MAFLLISEKSYTHLGIFLYYYCKKIPFGYILKITLQSYKVNICITPVNDCIAFFHFIVYNSDSFNFSTYFIETIIFSGIVPKSLSKSTGKTARIAESVHFCDLCYAILSALYELEAFAKPVIPQISGDRFSCHLFKKTTATLPGQVNLLCHLL